VGIELKSFRIILLLSIALVVLACVTPFSEMQSAGTLGSNNQELTGLYSSVYWKDDSTRDRIQTNVGLLAGFGLTGRLDLRFRWEMIQIKGNHRADDIFSLGPKYGVVPHYLSVFLPAGFLIGNGNSWEFHPTLLTSVPIMPGFEVNSSFKTIIYLSTGQASVYAANLGLALGNLKRWAIRPEVGVLFKPGEAEQYFHYSIGLTLRHLGG